ncbi:MAG: hypothetical protein NVS4B7_09800 [Ktedonobacteraceae bacterium]
MTEQSNPPNHLQSNEFNLAGKDVHLTYLTSDTDGKPHLSYKDAQYERSFNAEEIRVEQTELGMLVSVTLQIIVDFGSNTFTLLVPNVQVADLALPVETLAIKCHHRTTLAGPPPGAEQSYHVIHMNGSVQNPFLR